MRFLRIAVLLISLCAAAPVWALAGGQSVGVTAQERYNINLFLSNFSEQGMTHYDKARTTDAQLVDFAILHTWFNRKDRVEWGEWGEDTCRIRDVHTAEIVKKYFGRELTSLAPTKMPYRDGWYYLQEPGGPIGMGFACLSQVEALGEGRYGVYFGLYGGWENWTNEDCGLRPEQAAAKYSGSPMGQGCAVIDVGAGTLADRGTWALERYDAQL